MGRILVLGATGRIGREVTFQLLATGARVRALARHPAAANLPPGVEVLFGDLTLPDTLDKCLQGIDTVFLVWVAPVEFAAPCLERIASYARRIVFLSAPLKTAHPFFQQPNPSRRVAEQVETLIAASGSEWTFLRPTIFAGNARFWWAPQIRARQPVRWPYLAVHTSPIDERDIAAVAVRTLCEQGHAGKDYVLTGPESLSQAEQIAIIGRAIGHELTIEEITPEEARRELVSIMPLAVVNMLLDAWSAAAGIPAFLTTTVEQLTGAPARTFLDWATAHVADFRP